MIFILFLLPLLILLFSFLVLFNAGRNLKEKFTVFLYNPENTGKGSSNLMIRVTYHLMVLQLPAQQWGLFRMMTACPL